MELDYRINCLLHIMYKIKKGDEVKVMLGKDNGKTGAVERVFPKDGLLVVAGMNQYKRHVKRTQGMEGGIITLSKPMQLANVALICPNCKKTTRVGFKVESDGKTRVCKKCKKEIK